MRIESEIKGNTVTIFEARPYFRDPKTWTRTPVARLRFSSGTKLWTLFCADRNGKWHRYQGTEPTPDVAKLVGEILRDPTGIFWG